MADILVQNAVQEVANTISVSGTGINYAGILGKSLTAYIGDIAAANPTDGPYTVAAGGNQPLCSLSQHCCLSHCDCNYSGSGTNSTSYTNTASGWRNNTVLKGAGASITISAIRTKIFALDSSKLLEELYNTNTTQAAKDIYAAYVTYFVDSLSANIKQNWYGIGNSGGETQGARLSSSNYLKVCASGDSWKCGVGATCTWTVPSGATRVKFQVWGAGMGSNPGCCCGGDAGAHTGAYSEITMDATPGESYTVCAGCSCQRWCCSNSVPGEGCMSGVVGPGICCLMSDGAHCYNANCGSMNSMRCCFGYSACQRFQQPYCTTSGPCWCGYGEYCYDNSCSTCGVIPVYPACCDNASCYCSCACSDRNPTHELANGHRGIHGGACLDTNNYGAHIRPPVINADTGKLFCDGCWCAYFDSGTCCGGCNGTSWNSHPGLGGIHTHVMGGTTNHKGDTGKGGMVQISWN
jgi:hypothetical protein